MDMKLELVPLPVTDVDRAKAFYVDQVGFVADHDHTVSEELRFVQLTPPGSACSIVLRQGLGPDEPGARRACRWSSPTPTPAATSWSVEASRSARSTSSRGARFVYFADPDGNGWALQELPACP